MSETLPKDSSGKTIDRNTSDHASFGITKDGLIGRRTINGGPEASLLIKSVTFAESGGSQDMAINGSVTPVLFEVGPPNGEIWFISKIAYFMGDSGTINTTDFGAITGGIANGHLFEFFNQGTIHELGNFLINTDIGQFFIDELLKLDFADVGSNFRLLINFAEPMVLVGGPTANESDFLRFTVRDNLAPLNRLASTINYRRKLE